MFGVLHTSCYKGHPSFQNIESFKFLIYGGKTRLTKAQHDFEWKYMIDKTHIFSRPCQESHNLMTYFIGT